MAPSVLQQVSSLVGPNYVSTDPDVLAGRSVDHTGRYRGRAGALVRPGSAAEVAEVLRVCRDAGTHVTVQGEAGATLAAVQRAAATAGLVFGVDLAARDTATVGGMASTNAGGLRTVRYGNMGEQVIGLDVALPDGSVVRRHSRVRADNTGYDLPALFVGAEGTLGVITALDLRLHPDPPHRVTAVCGFDDLAALGDAGRLF